MPNRLAHAQSLYLRKHADNPIDWFPWGEEAIAKARQDKKPIFLSIGYSSCHWCTVMEGEAFSDQAIAEYMNAHFVAIKVDREERPDLDSIYMQALQLMTGQGGWPLNIFLSPEDLIPFYGGTYFPVDPKYGRPGFLQILQRLNELYATESSKIQGVKSEIFGRLQQAATLQLNNELTRQVLTEGLDYCAGILTNRSPGPRFPMIPYANAALHGMRLTSSEANYDARTIAQQRGLDLALGGIYDPVAGGFHRYTVDPTWTVPHFEKMLYDNGQIVEYLADLWSAGIQEPAFERAIAQTVTWLTREMTAPTGYFYAAQDADSFVTPTDAEPEEGAFYVWRYTELEQALTPEELSEITAQFTVSPSGNFEGQNVLQRLQPGQLSETTETALQKLFAIRYGALPTDLPTFPPARNNAEAKTHAWPGRIPAVTDTKMIVAWNSLMISGLARAAAVFQNAEYYAIATQAAQFIWTHQRVDGRLHRLNYEGQASVLAQSEDYALLIKALIDLHQAALSLNLERLNLEPSASDSWLDNALHLQAEFDDHLWSVELGGYYNTDARSDLVIRERSYEDNATPSANGVAIANLIRLFLLTEELSYFDRAEHALQAFSGIIAKAPQACPSLLVALDWFHHLTLVRTTADFIPPLETQYHPTVIYRLDSDLPSGSVGMVCQGLLCKAPAKTIEQMHQQLQQSLSRESVSGSTIG